jgi:hypothetical protein
MVRLAVAVATEALLSRTTTIELVADAEPSIDWVGGFAILSPGVLPVVVRRT